MKTNEAPEKLWIDPATDLPKLSGHIDKDSVEYIRKGAFIEKAVEWLRCHPSSHYDDLEEFSNAFRKAMKGE